MTTAFATATDLAKRLNVAAFSGTALEQVNLLLEDASAHLRAIIGWQVYPPATVTQTLSARGDLALVLAGAPVATVTAVAVDGVTVTDGYVLRDGQLRRGNGRGCYAWAGDVEVTYTVGYASAPPDLVAWTCVLASQVLSVAGDLGALGSGDVSSLQLGPDYRISWTQGEGAGYSLPPRIEDMLRTRYGTATHVTAG